jgi:hypothetical protein
MSKLQRTQFAKNRRRRRVYGVPLFIAVLILAAAKIPAAAKQSPTIRLFPTTVVENIKQT